MMSAETKNRPSKRKDMRQEILNVALSLFASHGFHSISTTEIAQRVGVSQPNIHYYFKNKQALWDATIDELNARMQATTQSAINHQSFEGLDPLSALKLLTVTLHRITREIPELGKLIHLEGQAGGERLEMLLEKVIMPGYNMHLDLIEKCIEQKLLKPYPPHQILMMLHGAVVSYYNLAPLVRMAFDVDPNEKSVSAQFTELCIDAVFSGLLV